jgi:hypothetical protein
MTTPLGNPAWLRSAGITDYGGSTTKADYLGIGVTNPDTDLEAAALMRLADHVAALTRTAPFAVLNITCNDSVPAAPTVNYVWMQSGICLVSYAGDSAPTGFPSASRNGDGDFDVDFDASYDDAYGIAGAFEIRMLDVGANAATNINAVATSTAGSQTATVHVFTANTGAAVQDETVTLTVW